MVPLAILSLRQMWEVYIYIWDDGHEDYDDHGDDTDDDDDDVDNNNNNNNNNNWEVHL
jgi:hypothetical protein